LLVKLRLDRIVPIAALLALLAAGAGAQAFPAKAVRVFTPFAAGSGPDAVLRLIGDKPSALWRQPVTRRDRQARRDRAGVICCGDR